MSTTIHPLNETDGSLNLSSLAFTASVKRALANDVTVCGENEPVAYVTEYFLGDGVTTEFDLAEDPFFPPTSKSTIVSELFNEPQINQTRLVRQRRRLYHAGTQRPGDERRQWH